MKVLENITSGYKKIATGIAIVSVLALMYIALIPGASLAYVYGPDGGVLSGAFIFIKEWPQYNATTPIDGTYSIPNVPYGDYTLVALGNDSYAPNITSINVSASTNFRDIQLKSAINYYLPFLYQRADNLYDAGVQIQNNGTQTANVEVTLHNSDGTIPGNDVYAVQSNKINTKHVFDITGTLPAFVGPAVVKSSVPVQLQGYIKTVNQDVYSIAPSLTTPSTISYLPFLYQRQDNLYDAGIQVYNPGTSTASVTITLYDALGNPAGTNTTSLDAKKQLTKFAFDITGIIPAFVGPAKITSSQPVVAQGFIRTKASNIYSIAPSISEPVNKSYLPFLYQRQDNLYDAGIQVYNPGTSTASVTINLYDALGNLAGTNTSTLNGGAELTRFVFDITGIIPFFVGPAEINSSEPVVAQGFIRTKASNVYSIAPQVRKPNSAGSAHLPFLYQTVSATHDAGIQVMNPNIDPAHVNIELYYPDGTLAGSNSSTVGSYAELTKFAFDIAPNGVDFNGSVVITGDQPIVSQGFIRKKSTNIYSIAPPVER